MNRIETRERLFLQNYTKKDKDKFIELFTDKEVMKHVGDGVLSEKSAEKLWKKLLEEFYPKGKNTIWAVFAKENSNYIGHASLRPRPEKKRDWEVGFILKKAEWGKGFATEIAIKLIEFGFNELELPEIYATVDDENFASINVLKKSGMKFDRFEFDEQGRFSVYSKSRNTKR